MRPDVLSRTYIYIGNLKKHADINEKQLKSYIVHANGKIRTSLAFLNDSSTDKVVKSRTNGKQRTTFFN